MDVTVKPSQARLAFNVENSHFYIGTTFSLDVMEYDAYGNELWSEIVSWTSSKPEIASVNEFGDITGLKAGTTVITAVSETGMQSSYSLKVAAPTIFNIEIDASGFKNASEEILLLVDEELDLNVNCWADDWEFDLPATWKSSNPQAVQIDGNGHLTAVGLGSAELTVTVLGKSVTCSVSVMENIEVGTIDSYRITLVGREVHDGETCKIPVAPNCMVSCKLEWKIEGNYDYCAVQVYGPSEPREDPTAYELIQEFNKGNEESMSWASYIPWPDLKYTYRLGICPKNGREKAIIWTKVDFSVYYQEYPGFQLSTWGASSYEEYTLSKYKGTDARVEIPSNLGGIPITSIAKGAFSESNVEELVIPGTVKYIGYEAFRNCETFKKVTFMEGIEKIGSLSFAGCSNLEEVILPSTVTDVSDFAFSSCTSLKRFKHLDTGEMGDCAIRGCEALQEVQLPRGITEISREMLGSTGIEEFHIPETVTTVRQYGFYSCEALRDIYFPASVTTIEAHLFEYSNPDLVMHVTAGSAAERYAKESSINFVVE